MQTRTTRKNKTFGEKSNSTTHVNMQCGTPTMTHPVQTQKTTEFDSIRRTSTRTKIQKPNMAPKNCTPTKLSVSRVTHLKPATIQTEISTKINNSHNKKMCPALMFSESNAIEKIKKQYPMKIWVNQSTTMAAHRKPKSRNLFKYCTTFQNERTTILLSGAINNTSTNERTPPITSTIEDNQQES